MGGLIVHRSSGLENVSRHESRSSNLASTSPDRVGLDVVRARRRWAWLKGVETDDKLVARKGKPFRREDIDRGSSDGGVRCRRGRSTSTPTGRDGFIGRYDEIRGRGISSTSDDRVRFDVVSLILVGITAIAHRIGRRRTRGRAVDIHSTTGRDAIGVNLVACTVVLGATLDDGHEDRLMVPGRGHGATAEVTSLEATGDGGGEDATVAGLGVETLEEDEGSGIGRPGAIANVLTGDAGMTIDLTVG